MSSSQVGILVSRWTAGNQNGFKKHKYKAVYHKSQYMNGSGVKVFIKLQILISNYVSLTYAFSNFLKMSLRNKYRKNLASTSTGKVKMLQDNTYVEENSWEPLDCKEIKPVNPKGNQSWMFIGRTHVEAENSSTLATWWEELTHLKRSWYWEGLKAGGEGDDGGWDGWIASPTQWAWVWVNSRSYWWTGRPGMRQSMGSQRVRHNWLNWTELMHIYNNHLKSLNFLYVVFCNIYVIFLLFGDQFSKL